MVSIPIQTISTELIKVLTAQNILAHLFAQAIRDPDVLGQIQGSFENFIESGQVWALIIGFVVGYVFRSFTSY